MVPPKALGAPFPGLSPALPELADSRTSPIFLETPEPIRLRRSSSFVPDSSAFCFFRGLPINSPFNESTADLAASDVPDAAGEEVETLFDAGGVVPEAGVFELVVVSPSGSAEC